MYAAAGGASLASRQARKRQQQQNNKQRLLQQKLAAARSAPAPARIQPSRQFHQLPSTYLHTPQAQARKLSATYSRQSQLLLPIVESNNQQQHHHHQQHQHLHQHFHPHHHHHETASHLQRPLSPKFGSAGTPVYHHHHHHLQQHHHLTKSATASFPLVSQVDATPPTTPLLPSINKQHPPGVSCLETPGSTGTPHIPHPQSQIQLPCPQDSIIVTPATPIASPGHKPSSPVPGDEGTLADSTTTGQLERKCSFYRVRKTEVIEHDENYSVTGPSGVTINTAQHHLEAYADENLIYGLPNGGSGHKWAQTAYCEQCTGICTCCEQIECAQGRAAWLERGRRCSVQDNNPASCHRRWKRNRIHDSSLGGSSDDEDLLGVLRGPSSFANAFLYVGLGTIAIGLVIAFVGTGEKGFKTVELRLIGPSLIGIGLICCILRIFFCICPSHCISSSRRARKKNSNKIDADHTTSLLRGESKRVSIAKGPHLQKIPLTHKRSNNKMLNEGMEALRQIATTSLFLQNEQKPSTNRVVPIIKEPEKPAEEAPLEMKKLDTTLNITDISDDEDEDEEAAALNPSNQTQSLVQTQGKLSRQRLPTNQQKQHLQQQKDSDTLLMETSLMVINPTTSSNLISTSPPPSTSKSLLPPHSTYDLPPSIPHQYPTVTNTSSSSSMISPDQQHTPPPPTTSIVIPSSLNISSIGTSTLQNQHYGSTLSPPPPTINSEPELVLSPAKLGQ